MTSPHPDLAIWSAAVNAALLGTSRAPLRVEAADGSLGAACTAVAGDEPEPSATLLRVAAAATVYRRCGRMAALSDEPPPAVCPPDTRPMCPPAAAALLRRIMNGEHASLIGEWLTLAARHGVRAPADALRDLLDLARREPKLRPLVLSVGGARAEWLAGQNAEWSFATAGSSPDALAATFETGTGPARLAALQQLRALDAERARTMLEASWAQDAPADRAAFAAALVTGLSLADEPFLERALDDRRKEVRQAAASLLARLPASALVARMTARAREFVTLGRSGLLKRLRVDVTLPETADAALVRDGVDAKPPAGIGERAWWLAQILAAVPPVTWTSPGSVDAEALLRAMEGHEWREPLVAGWLTATERHRDATWAAALWRNARVATVDGKWGAPSPARVFTSVVPADGVDVELRQSIGASRDALRGGHAALIAMLEWPNEWSDALARTVAHRLKEYAAAGVPLGGEYGLHALLGRSAHAAPVSAASAFTDGWPEQSDTWQTWAPAVDAVASALRFRSDLHLAFNEESSS